MMYRVDDDGVWWYHTKKQRTRAITIRCAYCNNEFPIVPFFVKEYNYCCRTCSNKSNAIKISLLRTGDKNHRWRGGRKRDGNGYIRVYKPDHPNADCKSCVLEHRLVMENHVKRLLHPFETVHHKNGIRDDNRLENLQLMCGLHPQGQTPEDLVKWAKQILNIYGKE